jgi:threonine/homoserine/homoserine lactone efflux protein
MLSFWAQGILLGMSAGFSPGPLSALAITETLRHGFVSGLRVALAPLLTDAPIVLVALFILSRLSNSYPILGIVSFVGSAVVLRMALETLRAKSVDNGEGAGAAKSLRKGIVVNVLSPHPYLFWLTVGAPTTLRAADHSAFAPWAFIGGFYFCLIGAKVALVLVVNRSRAQLGGRGYLYVMRFLGLLLVVFAIVLFRDGLSFFGILN